MMAQASVAGYVAILVALAGSALALGIVVNRFAAGVASVAAYLG